MAKKQATVPYSEVQNKVAAKRGRDLSEAKAEQVDELVALLNKLPGHAPVKNPLRGKAKGRPSPRPAGPRRGNRTMATDFSILREINPELADAIEGATNQPSSPYGVVAEQYPAIAEFLDNLGLPAGGAGLFHTGFKHAQVGPGDDEDLAYFDLRTLQTMPRVAGPGEAQIADKRGRLPCVTRSSKASSPGPYRKTWRRCGRSARRSWSLTAGHIKP